MVPAALIDFALDLTTIGEVTHYHNFIGSNCFEVTVGDWVICVTVADMYSRVIALCEEQRREGVVTGGGTSGLLESVRELAATLG